MHKISYLILPFSLVLAACNSDHIPSTANSKGQTQHSLAAANEQKLNQETIKTIINKNILSAPSHELTITKQNTSSFQLHFSDITLPKGAYLEITDAKHSQTHLHGFKDFTLNHKTQKYTLTSGLIFGGNVNVKVIYPKQISPTVNDRVILGSYEINPQNSIKATLGKDEKAPSIYLNKVVALNDAHSKNNNFGVSSNYL